MSSTVAFKVLVLSSTRGGGIGLRALVVLGDETVRNRIILFFMA
jgi:hypothetical protein